MVPAKHIKRQKQNLDMIILSSFSLDLEHSQKF